MRHVRPCTPCTSACVAAIAVSATCGTASAQSVPFLFTTLNSAKATLNSLGGSPDSSYWTYTGPATDAWAAPMTSFAQPNTGSATVWFGSFSGVWDQLNMGWSIGIPTTYSVRFEWDVTFSSVQGGVKFVMSDLALGSMTATPLAGSAAGLANGDFLANGRYTIAWDFTNATPDTTGVSQGIYFSQSSGGGGGAVPLPGAAGLAAIGLVGLSRRRRR
jgi:MprA protease rhombosortase-interaction domain-containing protein